MNPLDTQVGGGHYKDMAIQPVEFCQKNKLDYCEANVIKYICRWRNKNGLQDLEKVKHYVDLLIELEGLDTVADVVPPPTYVGEAFSTGGSFRSGVCFGDGTGMLVQALRVKFGEGQLYSGKLIPLKSEETEWYESIWKSGGRRYISKSHATIEWVNPITVKYYE
jgi:hypothetical protein